MPLTTARKVWLRGWGEKVVVVSESERACSSDRAFGTGRVSLVGSLSSATCRTVSATFPPRVSHVPACQEDSLSPKILAQLSVTVSDLHLEPWPPPLRSIYSPASSTHSTRDIRGPGQPQRLHPISIIIDFRPFHLDNPPKTLQIETTPRPTQDGYRVVRFISRARRHSSHCLIFRIFLSA